MPPQRLVKTFIEGNGPGQEHWDEFAIKYEIFPQNQWEFFF